MPQIDAVTYFPIIIWSVILVVLGYVLFTTYGLLFLSNISKIRWQWANYQVSRYWLSWNNEAVADWTAWTKKFASVLQTETTQK
jgi:hypothetical protein